MAGRARGRRILAPDGNAARPTTDRVREAVFNALGSMGAIDDATAVDLFAGSGALGLEALSRGAAQVTFVERDRRHAAVVRRNLDALGWAEEATVVVADALDHVGAMGPVDLALCDPPYAFDDWSTLLELLPADVVVAESDRPVETPARWQLARSKRYGGTFVTIASARIPPSPE